MAFTIYGHIPPAGFYNGHYIAERGARPLIFYSNGVRMQHLYQRSFIPENDFIPGSASDIGWVPWDEYSFEPTERPARFNETDTRFVSFIGWAEGGENG